MQDPKVASYLKFMKDSALLFGAPNTQATDQALRCVLDFEISLARASLNNTQARNIHFLNNPTVLREYPNLEGHPESWAAYISGVLGINITDDEVITIYDVNFLKVSHPTRRYFYKAIGN